MTDHFKEPIPPGIKNLDDFEIHFTPKPNYEKDIKVDDVFIEADKHDEQEEILDDDYDPTPYYLYDDTGGEPPMSADERHREAWEEKQRLKGRR